MTKYKCDRCGACFNDIEAAARTDLVDLYPDGRGYYQTTVICPECNSDDLTEIELINADCLEYDDLIGCEGDCDNCPLMTDKGDA